MTVESKAQDAQSLVEVAQGFARGKLLCAAVRLGIADVLGEGERHLDELAAATSSNSDFLYRFLRALAGIGIVTETAPACFVLTPLGEPLKKNAPRSVWASVVFWADLLADAWTYLPECIRVGSRSGATDFMVREQVQSRWSIVPDAQGIFHTVFAESTPDEMAPVVAAFDFSWCSVVADLGGAGGALVTAILAAHPRVHGILVDRQEAVDRAANRLAAAGLAERCDVVAGDLLETVPSGASAYILKCVLHGYDDANAGRILQHCKQVASRQCRILIIETVLPDKIDGRDPLVQKMLLSDLNMLAVTGGRERTFTQWTALLSATGLELLRVIPIADSIASIIEVAPAT